MATGTQLKPGKAQVRKTRRLFKELHAFIRQNRKKAGSRFGVSLEGFGRGILSPEIRQAVLDPSAGNLSDDPKNLLKSTRGVRFRRQLFKAVANIRKEGFQKRLAESQKASRTQFFQTRTLARNRRLTSGTGALGLLSPEDT